MKSLIVRAASLYVFNVIVLLLIGMFMASVRVGWHALWAAIVLTAATLALKPLLLKAFRGAAAKRGKAADKTVQYLVVFAAELIIWVLTVIFSGVDVRGWFWGYLLPPLFLLVAWVIYDQIDDKVEAKAGELYDSVRGGTSSGSAPSAPAPESPATRDARQELNDGLTAEQRKMLDDLG